MPIITSKYPKINIRYEKELSATKYNNCTFELNSDEESEEIPPLERNEIKGIIIYKTIY